MLLPLRRVAVRSPGEHEVQHGLTDCLIFSDYLLPFLISIHSFPPMSTSLASNEPRPAPPIPRQAATCRHSGEAHQRPPDAGDALGSHGGLPRCPCAGDRAGVDERPWSQGQQWAKAPLLAKAIWRSVAQPG